MKTIISISKDITLGLGLAAFILFLAGCNSGSSSSSGGSVSGVSTPSKVSVVNTN